MLHIFFGQKVPTTAVGELILVQLAVLHLLQKVVNGTALPERDLEGFRHPRHSSISANERAVAALDESFAELGLTVSPWKLLKGDLDGLKVEELGAKHESPSIVKSRLGFRWEGGDVCCGYFAFANRVLVVEALEGDGHSLWLVGAERWMLMSPAQPRHLHRESNERCHPGKN